VDASSSSSSIHHSSIHHAVSRSQPQQHHATWHIACTAWDGCDDEDDDEDVRWRHNTPRDERRQGVHASTITD